MRHLLVLAGLLVMTWMVRSYFDPIQNPVGLGSDGYEYWHLSTNLLKNHQFVYSDPAHYPLFDLKPLVPTGHVPPTIACTTRVPGYPFLLAMARGILDSPWAAIILNYLAYIGICVYGFLLGDMLLKHSLRRVYEVLLVFTPLYFVRWGMGSDLCAGFLTTAFTYHILQKNMLVAGAWAILANLTRTNLLVYTVLLTLFTLNRRRAILVLLMVAIALGGWILRNKNLTDQWTLSNQGGSVLHTVHMVYPNLDSNQRKSGLFINYLNKRKTFNQTEALVDHDLKTLVTRHFQQQPFDLVKQEINGLRTLFMFSYFDISNALTLAHKPLKERLDFVNSSSADYPQGWLFQISRAYKILLALGFFGFALLLFFPKSFPLKQRDQIKAIYIATLVSILITAFYTGAGGDRLRLPFNVPLLIFALFFWSSLKTLLKRS